MVFCICLILTYDGGFNMLASYNLQSTFSGYSFYYTEQKKAGKNPVFKASSIGLKEKTDYWK